MHTKIRCLLLDDELPGLSYLKMLCEQIPGVEVIRAFNQAGQFLEQAASLEYDICLLDIEMPGINGLEIARHLSGKPVIFVTAYKGYAADAFDLHAVDYVRKPISLERLAQAFGKARAKLLHPAKDAERLTMQLRTSLGTALVFLDELVYVTTSAVDPRDKRLFLKGGRELLAKNLTFLQLLERLPATDFCQINKKEIVALHLVHAYTAQEVVLLTGAAIPDKVRLVLSETYRPAFLKHIAAL